MKKTSLSILLSAVLLAACGSGGKDAPAPEIPAPIPTFKTFTEAVRKAETSGSIPVLDRSATLSGTDSNANGIRDDIETHINSMPDTATQKNALRQTAQAFTSVLTTNLADSSALTASSTKLSNASSCLFSRYPSPLASKRAREMEKLHINTRQRFDAYDAYNAALSGTTSLAPAGDGCEN
ncbi:MULTISPECIES: hypothetical protein [unclassified Janthinobacterium]|uniref:hypothetical protein n=1 Tax=unclassified Janthinobacterium TaxID=2610881 RepID=UPI0018C903B4|nr:hypothetical protein [Janthinobacterium sp. CG_23.4]MDH6156494.1 hypothetical protein [Janthinobacterium sp. CG_23.4]